jgi:hypothetical protein
MDSFVNSFTQRFDMPALPVRKRTGLPNLTSFRDPRNTSTKDVTEEGDRGRDKENGQGWRARGERSKERKRSKSTESERSRIDSKSASSKKFPRHKGANLEEDNLTESEDLSIKQRVVGTKVVSIRTTEGRELAPLF